jgi:hypothetical protein
VHRIAIIRYHEASPHSDRRLTVVLFFALLVGVGWCRRQSRR